MHRPIGRTYGQLALAHVHIAARATPFDNKRAPATATVKSIPFFIADPSLHYVVNCTGGGTNTCAYQRALFRTVTRAGTDSGSSPGAYSSASDGAAGRT